MTLACDLFDQAEAYRSSAAALQKAEVLSVFSFVPIVNLYSHAVALYLKAYLHLHGHPLEELDGKYRNDFRRMKKRAEAYGLRVAGADKAAMEYYLRTPAAVRLKYLATPYYSPPSADELDALCGTLSEHVGAKVGSTVRY